MDTDYRTRMDTFFKLLRVILDATVMSKNVWQSSAGKLFKSSLDGIEDMLYSLVNKVENLEDKLHAAQAEVSTVYAEKEELRKQLEEEKQRFNLHSMAESVRQTVWNKILTAAHSLHADTMGMTYDSVDKLELANFHLMLKAGQKINAIKALRTMISVAGVGNGKVFMGLKDAKDIVEYMAANWPGDYGVSR